MSVQYNPRYGPGLISKQFRETLREVIAEGVDIDRLRGLLNYAMYGWSGSDEHEQWLEEHKDEDEGEETRVKIEPSKWARVANELMGCLWREYSSSHIETMWTFFTHYPDDEIHFTVEMAKQFAFRKGSVGAHRTEGVHFFVRHFLVKYIDQIGDGLLAEFCSSMLWQHGWGVINDVLEAKEAAIRVPIDVPSQELDLNANMVMSLLHKRFGQEFSHLSFTKT